MKKIISIFILVFAFTFAAQAQKKGSKFQAERMLKKLTKDLNLTEVQQEQIKPLLVAQIADRKLLSKKRKAMKESGEKPSREDRKKMREEREAKQTAMNSKMATILTEEQFEKFKVIAEEQKNKTRKNKKKPKRRNK